MKALLQSTFAHAPPSTVYGEDSTSSKWSAQNSCEQLPATASNIKNEAGSAALHVKMEGR